MIKNNLKIQKYSDVKVSIFLSISIIVIFLLYVTNIIKSIPCQKKLLSNFYSNFFHIEITHLISNIIGLYALSRIERNIGIKKFIKLIILILLFNSVFETILYILFPNMLCSIGISGILYGLITYEICTNKEIDYVLIIYIFSNIMIPYKNVSVSSHIIGAISGIIISKIIKI